MLEEVELIQVEKGYDGKRPKTWGSITVEGRQALEREIAALRALISRHDS